MPRIYGKFSKIKMDGQWTQRVNDGLQIMMRQAARAWLRAIILYVPVWTGFAKGSIKFASGPQGFLGAALNVAIPINPSHTRPKWYYHPGRKTRVRKIPQNGGRFSRYNFSVARKVYYFSFRSDVAHFIINDFYGSHATGAAWGASEKGKRAFEEYIVLNFNRVMTDVGSFLLTVDVPFGQ